MMLGIINKIWQFLFNAKRHISFHFQRIAKKKKCKEIQSIAKQYMAFLDKRNVKLLKRVTFLGGNLQWTGAAIKAGGRLR